MPSRSSSPPSNSLLGTATTIIGALLLAGGVIGFAEADFAGLIFSALLFLTLAVAIRSSFLMALVPLALAGALGSDPAVESMTSFIGVDGTNTTLNTGRMLINLKPKAEWRPGMTVQKLIAEMDGALQFPGISNSWTWPIRARIDMLAFGLGSGVAGIAGVALSQIDNVSPNLGQGYIIDSFMVVVFGGVGNLWGTLVGALSLGIANKFLEPFAGAVLGKIGILVLIILFIQKRPRGLFAPKGRAVEA